MLDRAMGGSFPVALMVILLAGCATGGAPAIEKVDRTVAAEAAADGDSFRGGFSTEFVVLRNPDVAGGSPSSGYDILHADLDLSFDFERPRAIGRVTYHLVVLRAGLPEIRLDAVGLVIDSVRVARNGRVVLARHDVDATGVSVRTSAPLARADTVEMSISYSSQGTTDEAMPGFHFADRSGNDPYVPDQVWAGDGQARARAWLPTWDHPAEQMTFTIAITVPDVLTTLAPGDLVEQEVIGETGRRDTWSLDLPQPAARIGFAAGAFNLIGDVYESPVGKRSSLIYAVDPGLEWEAGAVFSPVPAMMSVMERRTAVEYPFVNYSHVSVWRHSGQASALGGLALIDRSVLRDDRALLDDTGESLLMSLMASQWFGSWITVGEQAAQPLTEGIGRLFEWIYLEDAGRTVEAEERMLAVRNRYFEEAASLRRPVILRDRDWEVSRAHAADKSALVLSQLGFVMGDEAWWRALRDFTARGARAPVTLGDLRESMEQAARRPLTEYFDQWFLGPGHPEVIVDHEYDSDVGIYTMRIRQVQDGAAFPTFLLDTDVEISFESRPPYRERIQIASRDTTLRFGVSGRIRYARLDTEGRLLADIRERKPLPQWLAQAEEDAALAGRFAALRYLATTAPSADVRDVLMRVGRQDPSPRARAEAIFALGPYAGSGVALRFLLDRSALDVSPVCRKAALEVLEEAGDPSALGAFRRALADSSYAVVTAAVRGLSRLAPESFWAVVRPLTTESSWNDVVDMAVIEALRANPTTASAAFLTDRLEPHNPERVRLAALAAFSRLASVDRTWRAEVKSAVQVLMSDHSKPVRDLARQIVREM